ncbi:hypothetical protein BX070DRAFT_119787 [Coemansia spiralis]|nr:hypothetical protein BX070DRAFT_119787 [Coemansia spiralis]
MRRSIAGTLAGWTTDPRWDQIGGRRAERSASPEWLRDQEPPMSPLFASYAEPKKRDAKERWFQVDVYRMFTSPLSRTRQKARVVVHEIVGAGLVRVDLSDPDVLGAVKRYLSALPPSPQKQRPTGMVVPTKRHLDSLELAPSMTFTVRSSPMSSDHAVRAIDIEAMVEAYLPHPSLAPSPESRIATLAEPTPMLKPPVTPSRTSIRSIGQLRDAMTALNMRTPLKPQTGTRDRRPSEPKPVASMGRPQNTALRRRSEVIQNTPSREPTQAPRLLRPRASMPLRPEDTRITSPASSSRATGSSGAFFGGHKLRAVSSRVDLRARKEMEPLALTPMRSSMDGQPLSARSLGPRSAAGNSVASTGVRSRLPCSPIEQPSRLPVARRALSGDVQRTNGNQAARVSLEESLSALMQLRKKSGRHRLDIRGVF